MKKLVSFLIGLFLMQTFAWADTDKPIAVTQLPAKAQTFISTYFKSSKVALAKKESGVLSKSYEVVFTSGDKVEFDRQGEWTEVKCLSGAVPIRVVPAAIRDYVKVHYPDAKVQQMERDDKEYEVKLTNRVELKFNNKFQLIDIDTD